MNKTTSAMGYGVLAVLQFIFTTALCLKDVLHNFQCVLSGFVLGYLLTSFVLKLGLERDNKS